ncbi:MAG: heavy metal translocating P-type ATPase, partial [Gammaproteobacteria bacterium]
NQTGTFLYRATRIGKDTVLWRIIELVKKAQNSKPSISRLVDRISWYFVPSVIICAIITALIWYDIGPSPQVLYMLITGMTVLIIACPCALGLGTPLSIMVGVGSAAERGILIRNGDALQSTKKITTVIFDKTGTITQGKPSVTKIISLSDESEDNLLQIAASLEIGSEHPLAEAIKTAAKEQHLTLLQITDFQNLTGLGVIGTIKSHSVMLGNKKLLTKMDVPLENFSQKNDEAATVIYIVRDKKIIGLIFITDPVKPESISAIERLHQMNIKTIMITGDNEITASKIAKEVKIKEFFSELLPGDKLQIIKKQQLKGEIVAMVGDGINDAPALAQANIGYAIGSGTDIAMESADITLMNSSLNNIADSIIISNATMRNIKQNLFGAFIYNMMGIPIAAGILYPFINLLLNPMIAGAAMAFSSVTIVLNANRLRGIIRNLITTPE